MGKNNEKQYEVYSEEANQSVPITFIERDMTQVFEKKLYKKVSEYLRSNPENASRNEIKMAIENIDVQSDWVGNKNPTLRVIQEQNQL